MPQGWFFRGLTSENGSGFHGDDEMQCMPKLNRVLLTYASEAGEKFYGFGEQFSCFDMKGKRVPIMVQEQGIGRGDQPITMAANLVSYRCRILRPFYTTSFLLLQIFSHRFSFQSCSSSGVQLLDKTGMKLQGRRRLAHNLRTFTTLSNVGYELTLLGGI